jgi:hypothetical protein
LNAWLGGFDSILRRMTLGNFDWFLHSMLFYHTQKMTERQQNASNDNSSSDSDSNSNSDSDSSEV